MRELGIEPVQQVITGFAFGFQKAFSPANVHPQGTWCAPLSRPDMLDPSDPLFAKLAASFYASQKKFLERQNFWLPMRFMRVARQRVLIWLPVAGIYAAMASAYPNVTWVFQSWQGIRASQCLTRWIKLNASCSIFFASKLSIGRNGNSLATHRGSGAPSIILVGNDFISSRLTQMADGPAKRWPRPDQARARCEALAV